MNSTQKKDKVRDAVRHCLGCGALAAALAGGGSAAAAGTEVHDVVIRNALIYDGSGGKPYAGDIAIDADRLAYVGAQRALEGRQEIDAHGQAAAPGFIDMMGHSEESLLIDGRAVSGLKQGVTLDIFTELSMGPMTEQMARQAAARQGDLKYDVAWRTPRPISVAFAAAGIRPQCSGEFRQRGAWYASTFWVRAMLTPTPEQLNAVRAPSSSSDGRGRSGGYHSADLRSHALREDVGTRRHGAGIRALRRRIHGAYAQRRRSHRRGGAGDHRYRTGERRARGDSSFEVHRPFELGQARENRPA